MLCKSAAVDICYKNQNEKNRLLRYLNNQNNKNVDLHDLDKLISEFSHPGCRINVSSVSTDSTIELTLFNGSYYEFVNVKLFSVSHSHFLASDSEKDIWNFMMSDESNNEYYAKSDDVSSLSVQVVNTISAIVCFMKRKFGVNVLSRINVKENKIVVSFSSNQYIIHLKN